MNSAQQAAQSAGGVHAVPVYAAPVRGGRRYDMRDVVAVLFRDRAVVGWTFIVIAALFIAISFLPGVTYEARARLLVLLSRDYVLDPQAGEIGNALTLGEDQIIRSEIEILTSRELTEKVLKTVGIATLYPGLVKRKGETPQLFAQANEQFLRALKVERVGNSAVISVGFTHEDRYLAAETLNVLINQYLEHRRLVLSADRADILTSQRDDVFKRLRGSEEAIKTFRLAYGISNFDEQKSDILRRFAELSDVRLATERRLQEARASLARVRRDLSLIPANIPLFTESSRPSALENASRTLLDLEIKKREYLTKYKPDSRFLTDLEKQITEIRNFLSEEKEMMEGTKRVGRNPVYDELQKEAVGLEAEIASLEARRIVLTGQLRELAAERARLERLEPELKSLERTRVTLENSYRAYAGKAEEARLQEDADEPQNANVHIVERATPPTRGRNVQPIIILAGLFLAFVSAIAVGVIRHLGRSTFVTPESAARTLHLPVLVSVPDFIPLRVAEGQVHGT
jgi:uncharacterized protein involved in exopolysaccharide biosynthesis